MRPLTDKESLINAACPRGFSQRFLNARVRRAAWIGAWGLAAGILSISTNAPRASAQSTPVAAVDSSAIPPDSNPTPQPTTTPDEDDSTSETQIWSTDGGEFDAKNRVALFVGQVHVSDTRFELWCDKLTVHMNKAASADGAPAPAHPTPEQTSSGRPAKDESSGGIDTADAEGHVVIQRKTTDSAGQVKISTGHGERALFDNKTGDVTLSGNPSLQQELNEVVATSPKTYFVIDRDNRLKTFGPSRTLIRQKNQDQKAAVAVRPKGAGQN